MIVTIMLLRVDQRLRMRDVCFVSHAHKERTVWSGKRARINNIKNGRFMQHHQILKLQQYKTRLK